MKDTKNLMKTTTLACKAIIITLAFCAKTAMAGGVACAVDEALRAKADLSSDTLPASTVTLSDHKFNLHAVRVTEEGKRSRTLEGKIVRVIGDKKQDTVAFRIAKAGGAIRHIDVRINGNDWTPLSKEMTAAFGKLPEGGPMTQDDRDAVFRNLQKTAGADWQRLTELLIAHIAVREC